MYKTIAIGSNILVQGIPESVAPDGRMIIRIGERQVQGWPVNHDHDCHILKNGGPTSRTIGAP